MEGLFGSIIKLSLVWLMFSFYKEDVFINKYLKSVFSFICFSIHQHFRVVELPCMGRLHAYLVILTYNSAVQILHHILLSQSSPKICPLAILLHYMHGNFRRELGLICVVHYGCRASQTRDSERTKTYPNQSNCQMSSKHQTIIQADRANPVACCHKMNIKLFG